MKKPAYNRIDYTGLKKNKLTLLKFVKIKNNRAVWLCKCDCGNLKEIPGHRVKSGVTKSCGCIRNDKKAQSFLNRLYHIYKRAAGKRDYVFEITKERFAKLIKQNCFYCGDSPSGNSYSYMISNYSEDINGIDRKDNNIGYIEENIVSCCKQCNNAKMMLSDTEFIELCKRVVNNQEKK